MPMSSSADGTTIKGLDCGDTDQAVALLDLDTLEDKDWYLPDSGYQE